MDFYTGIDNVIALAKKLSVNDLDKTKTDDYYDQESFEEDLADFKETAKDLDFEVNGCGKGGEWYINEAASQLERLTEYPLNTGVKFQLNQAIAFLNSIEGDAQEMDDRHEAGDMFYSFVFELCRGKNLKHNMFYKGSGAYIDLDDADKLLGDSSWISTLVDAPQDDFYALFGFVQYALDGCRYSFFPAEFELLDDYLGGVIKFDEALIKR